MKELFKSNRTVGYVVIVLSLLCLGQLLYFSYTNRQITECQSRVNQVFLETVKQRAAISDGDRDAIRLLVTDLVAANTPKESKEALEEYYQRNDQLDALRKSFQYPDLGSC